MHGTSGLIAEASPRHLLAPDSPDEGPGRWDDGRPGDGLDLVEPDDPVRPSNPSASKVDDRAPDPTAHRDESPDRDGPTQHLDDTEEPGPEDDRSVGPIGSPAAGALFPDATASGRVLASAMAEATDARPNDSGDPIGPHCASPTGKTATGSSVAPTRTGDAAVVDGTEGPADGPSRHGEGASSNADNEHMASRRSNRKLPRVPPEYEQESDPALGPDEAGPAELPCCGPQAKGSAAGRTKKRTRKVAAPTEDRNRELDQFVAAIQSEQSKIERNEGSIVECLIAIGMSLTLLKKAFKGYWLEVLKTLKYSDRIARRLIQLAKAWGEPTGRLESDLLLTLPVDLNKLEWLCKLDSEPLRDLLLVRKFDCKKCSRPAVIQQVKALLGEAAPAPKPKKSNPIKDVGKLFDSVATRVADFKSALADEASQEEFRASIEAGIKKLRESYQS